MARRKASLEVTDIPPFVSRRRAEIRRLNDARIRIIGQMSLFVDPSSTTHHSQSRNDCFRTDFAHFKKSRYLGLKTGVMIENWGEFSWEDGAGSVVALIFGPVLSRPFSALIYRLIPRNFRKRTRIALVKTHLDPSSRLHCSNSAFVWRNSASTCAA